MKNDSERTVIVLSDAEIDAIAEKVETRFYSRVGRKVVDKLIWFLGFVIVGLFVFLSGKGIIEPPK